MTQLQLPLFENLRKECEELRKENARLRAELSRLQGLLKKTANDTTVTESAVWTTNGANPTSVVEETAQYPIGNPDEFDRVNLFRSIFRGRADVHAVRWEAKGKSGYAPARKHDWDGHSIDPKTGRKICGPGCKNLPLTDEVIRNHLETAAVVGIYPMLPDETCCFLAVDFDKSSWMDDSSAFMDVCDSLSVPAYLERSRSGNGGHVWIFFDRAIPASQARKLGAALLTKCRNQRYELGFDSYDRMFPNQDTMPKGQFGNLIALPLQYTSTQQNNAVFIDRNFEPFADQWSFLSSIRLMAASRVDQLVRNAAKENAIIPVRQSGTDDDSDVDPWTQPPSGSQQDNLLRPPVPPTAKVTLSNLIYLDKAGFSPSALSRLISIAAFQNPEFYKYQAMRMSTFGRTRVISCSTDFPKHIGFPRGSMEQLEELLKSNGIDIEVQDERYAGTPIEASFAGVLRPLQEQAANELLQHDIGVLSAATAFGKTVVAAYCIASRRVNTLVLVHRAQLLDQWTERLASFLNLGSKSLGQVGGGKDKRTGIVDVATIQSLQRQGVVKDLVAEYGQVIIDECHHIPAFTFEQVLKGAKAKYVLGLTATPIRKDGHHPIVMMQCGPIRFKVTAREHNEASNILEHLVILRQTSFQSHGNDVPIQELYSLLSSDEQRNDLLFNDILQALEQRRTPLVITERTDHLDQLVDRLRGFAKNIIVFRGGLGKKQRLGLRAQLDAVPANEERVVLATGRYIGEGFDDSRLDTLFLAMPISWRGTLQQYAGRLHRAHEGKSVVRIYDYVDGSVAMLAKMYERRLQGYKSIGYRIVEPE